jgi:L-threonylcarbamoyladenylate synthase
MLIVKPQNKSINDAVDFLNKGGIVICPTDTVYGFLADATNKKAVDKIYKIKKRSKSKPLPLFVKDLKMAKKLADIDNKQIKILKDKWPGKYTFILPSSRGAKVTKQSIALRIPNYKFLNSLLRKINKPLAQTSVNISGQKALIKSADIEGQFSGQKILFIDAGNLKKSKPSKIVDLTEDKIKFLRK